MSKWIAINKSTQKEYGPYTDSEKESIENSPVLKLSYRFKEINIKKTKNPIGDKAEGTKSE